MINFLLLYFALLAGAGATISGEIVIAGLLLPVLSLEQMAEGTP